MWYTQEEVKGGFPMRDLLVVCGFLGALVSFGAMFVMMFFPSTCATVTAFVAMGVMGLAAIFLKEN
jgi:hypothetical protein